MANSVKFYSMSALPTTIDPNGLYFVNGGELYKGATRFGCGKVTQLESAPSEGMARGDVNISNGKTEIYDGTSWVTVTADVSVVQSQWQADIKSWVSGLAVGDSNSYITNITQDVNGKVVATAVSFPSFVTGDADGQVKLGSINASVSGWDTLTASVSDLDSRVTDLEAWQSSISGDEITGGTKVTAESGKFTNLTVTDTATFSATNISADTLTIGGSTVEDLADKEIASIAEASASGSSNGVEVVVTTQSGSVKEVGVSVDVATDISSSTGTGLVTEGLVYNKISSLGNVMRFRGAGTTLPTDPKVGDVYVFTSEVTIGTITYKAGTEVVYVEESGTGRWEVIGDNTSWALNAYSKAGSAVMSGVTTVPGALDALAGAVDTLNGDDETAGSVVYTATSIVTSAIEALDSSVSCSESGVNVTITQADGKLTGVTAELVWLTA